MADTWITTDDSGKPIFTQENLYVAQSPGKLTGSIEAKLGRVNEAAKRCREAELDIGGIELLGNLTRAIDDYTRGYGCEQWRNEKPNYHSEPDIGHKPAELLRYWHIDDMLVVFTMIADGTAKKKDCALSSPVKTIYAATPMSYDPWTDKFHWNLSPPQLILPEYNDGPAVSVLFEVWQRQDQDMTLAFAFNQVVNPCDTGYCMARDFPADFGTIPQRNSSWSCLGYAALLENGLFGLSDSKYMPAGLCTLVLQATQYAIDTTRH